MNNYSAVPKEMLEARQWVPWKLTQKPGAPKPTKVPRQAKNPQAGADTTNPAHCGSIQEALAAKDRANLDGVGFVFTGTPYFGVDLDNALDDKGHLHPWAEEIVQRFEACAFIEWSPSGTGLHLIGRGGLPLDAWHKVRPLGADDSGIVEVYDTGRFFTVTGRTFFDFSGLEIGNAQDALDWLQAKYAKPKAKSEPERPKPEPKEADPETEDLEDQVVIDRAKLAANGAKFDALMRGDLSGHGDDHSAGDLALCSILAFWTRDAAQIDRIFRASALMRPKWDERRGRDTYGAITIQKALELVPKAGASDWNPNRGSTGSVSPRERLKALTVQKEYVSMLGKETWLLQNLIIKGQILTVIAKSGGGKTAIFFDFVVPWIISNHDDMTVFYFDCDSPASDHGRMMCKAEEIGSRFQWINPLTHGKGPEVLVDTLKEFVASGERLDDAFFILDTLKKFIDMLDKKSVKPFFSLLRQLTALGATIVLLGHANKHRDNDGNLVFEGVGDVASDTDAMLIFERVKSADGGIDVTTICDPDKGAKVRGLYKPISFHVAPDRTVTLCKDVVAVPDYSKNATKRGRLTEEEIEERIREYLEEKAGVVPQKEILGEFQGEAGASFHAVRKVLAACAVPEYEATGRGQIFVRAGGIYNQKLYGVCR